MVGSDPVIGACMTRGVSGRRPPKGERGLRPLLAGGGPSAGTTLGSWVMVRVVSRVMAVYWPSAEIRQ